MGVVVEHELRPKMEAAAKPRRGKKLIFITDLEIMLFMVLQQEGK